MLDATAINVAPERTGVELETGFPGPHWTINAYTLTLVALILAGAAA